MSSMVKYYLNRGYTPEQAEAMANPPRTRPARARKWFRKRAGKDTLWDTMPQRGKRVTSRV